MYYFLISAAIVFFLIHVGLLLVSFQNSALVKKHYFYSHFTLWIAGIMVFTLALLYAGSGKSTFLDYFDTIYKQVMILVFTAALSLVAHLTVKFIVLPLLTKKA